MMRSIKELLKKAVEVLRDGKSSATPILDAELLLVYILNQAGDGFDRLKLVTHQELLIDEQTAGSFMALVQERSKGKPVQYIINRQEFMGLELYVMPGVLIPRSDTEIVTEKVIELARGMEKPNILDMCTGSGAIAVSLAKYIPDAKLWAVDVSDTAVECCGINTRRFGLEDRVRIIKGDLFENLRDEGLSGIIDIVVSNPPYIETAVMHELDINVRDYEPHLALDGGKDGLVYYRRIVQDAACFLKSKGVLAFEIGYDQGSKVKSIMEESGCYYGIELLEDLAGFDRCVWGYRY